MRAPFVAPFVAPIVTLFVAVSIAWVVEPSGAVAAMRTCARGGECRLGDVGPGGGIVFFAAPSPQWWGQYLEVANRRNRTGSLWDTAVVHQSVDAKVQRILGKQIGAGASNTQRLANISDVWRAREVQAQFSSPRSGSRWYVPSKDELDALYNFVVTSNSPLRRHFTTGLKGRPYWTSSEASDTFAWYQLFHDGTQFTDANGVVPGLTGNKQLQTSSEHRGSAFMAANMQFAFVRAFAPNGVMLPPHPPLPVVPAGGRADDSSLDCARGISCRIGDIGPGGGVVFYDAGSSQSWGRYLEASPATCQGSGQVWRVARAGKDGTRELPLLYPVWSTAARQRVESKRLGMGRINTTQIVRQHRRLPQAVIETTAAGYADALVCGGKDDWFLPSKDELDTLYNVLALTDNDLSGNNSFGFLRGYYWTSSEYNNETAWTQLWVDGQQFDREKWLSANTRRDGGLTPFHVRPIRAFG